MAFPAQLRTVLEMIKIEHIDTKSLIIRGLDESMIYRVTSE